MKVTKAALGFSYLALSACSCRTPTASEGDASAPHSSEIFGVPRRPLGCAPMLFHPTRSLVGELEGARCHVWDLDGKAYRGSVDASVCKAWSRAGPAPVVPPGIVSATPHAPKGGNDALVFARSRDGSRALSGRRNLGRVSSWSGPAVASVKELTIDDARWELDVVGLTFTSKNEPVALTLGNGPVLWFGDNLEARQPANERHINVRAISADPQSRYVGYSGTMDWGRSWFSACAVIRTSDGEAVLENSGDPPPAPRVLWAEQRNAALVLDIRPHPVEPGDDVFVSARLESLASGSVATDGFERGILRLAAISPRGTAVLLGYDAFGEAPRDEEGPDARSVKHVWSVFGSSFHDEMSGAVAAVAWANDEGALCVALDDGTISVVSLAPSAKPPLARRAAWKGRAPVALAPDGANAAFVQGGVLVFGSVVSKKINRSPVEAPSVLAWGPRAIAVATSDEVLLLEAGSRAVLHRLSLASVTALLWEPTGARIAAVMPGKLRVVEADGNAGSDVPLGLDARVAWVNPESLVIREKTQIRRMMRRGGAWVEEPQQHGVPGNLASHDGLFLAEGEAIRRVADEEVLHLDREGNFTDSGAYDRTPSKEAGFREGDVIDGRLVGVEEMAQEPTIDLVARFASGAAIPHQKRSH